MTVDTRSYVPSFLIEIGEAKWRYGIASDIASVSITETVNQADSFVIRLRDHYPDPVLLRDGKLSWTESEAFDEGAAIKIALGYLENPDIKVRLKGYITGVAIGFTEDGSSTTTVRGYSRYQDLQRTSRSQAFGSMTDSEIAEAITSEIAKAIPDADVMTGDIETSGIVHEQVSYSEDVTYAHILEDHAKCINYEVAVKGDLLIFRRPRYLAIPQPQKRLNLVWGQSLRSVSIDINRKACLRA